MEQWKPIYQNNNYEISNKGRVKSYNYKSDGKLLTPTQKNKNYKSLMVYVILCRNYHKKAYPVNKLVYEHFIGRVPKGYIVFNKDRNPWNNSVENLALMSRKDYMFALFNNLQPVKNQRHVKYTYYIDNKPVGSIKEFMKATGEKTHQNVSGRFTKWENRKKKTKWHIDEGVVFNGKICTRTKHIVDGLKFIKTENRINHIKTILEQ